MAQTSSPPIKTGGMAAKRTSVRSTTRKPRHVFARLAPPPARSCPAVG
nr:MAG TPA: hypothetical protein [Caudoviricetes sp.]